MAFSEFAKTAVKNLFSAPATRSEPSLGRLGMRNEKAYRTMEDVQDGLRRAGLESPRRV